jgi:hypothetical protein
LELGFAEVDSKGKMVIPREQLAKIVNIIDETCLVGPFKTQFQKKVEDIVRL